MHDSAQQANGLPAGWVRTTLGEIADTTRKRIQPQDYPTLRFIGMEHVEAHTMRILATVPAAEMRSSAEYFEPGDVLYGRLRPYLNKVFCADFTGLCSGEFIPFRKNEQVASEYLLYFLNSWEFVSFASHLNEGDRPRVSFDQLADYPFPLAPLPEQHRIVAEIETQFTRLDAGVAALKRVQANLRRYKASVLKAACEGRLVPTEAELARTEGRPYEPADALLQRILAERRAKWEAENPKKKYKEPAAPDTDNLPELPEGWVWATVEQVSELVQYGTSEKANIDPVGVPVLRMGNIQDGRLDFSDLKYLPVDTPKLNSFVLDYGDILFNRTNSAELVGKTGVYKSHHPTPATFASYLIRIKVCDGYLPDLLAVYVNSLFGRRYISSVVSQQVGQANVNGTKLKNMSVTVPPIAEQHRIVAEVERRLSVVQEMEATVAANLKRAERLRQSILKRAFEGRLVAQDANDEPASALLERIRAGRVVGA